MTGVMNECEAKIIIALHGEQVLCDEDDFEWLSKHKWHINSVGQVCCSQGQMSRMVTKAVNGEIVDHIFHNKLDNRKSKLRKVTKSQNAMNKVKQSNNTSGCTGVVKLKDGRWLARIKVNGKYINLGTDKDYDKMVTLRKNAEVKYFGPYAYKEAGADE